MDMCGEIEKRHESEPFADVIVILQERMKAAADYREVANRALMESSFPPELTAGSFLMASERGPDENDPESEYMYLELPKQKKPLFDARLEGMFKYGAFVHRFLDDEGEPNNEYFVVELPNPDGPVFYGVNRYGAYVLDIVPDDPELDEERNSALAGVSNDALQAELDRMFSADAEEVDEEPDEDPEIDMELMALHWQSRLALMNPRLFTDA